MLYRIVRLLIRGGRRERFVLSRRLTIGMIGVSVLVFALLVGNGVGVGFHRSLTGYLVGLFHLIAVSALFFARLVHRGLSDQTEGTS